MQVTSLKSERRHYIKSSSFIMALLFTLLCGLAALSLAYFINYFAKGHFIHNTEALLDLKIRYLEMAGPERAAELGQIYLDFNPEETLSRLTGSDVSRLAEGILVFNEPEDGRRYAAKIHTMQNNEIILVGTDITDIASDFKFMQWLGIVSICFVMVVVFVSYLISVFVVTGTNKIAETAQEIINTGDLSRRIEVNSRWDDLSNMTAVLNMLLERIEDLMQGVRQVSDNIAHDLRTPLTRIRNKLDSLNEGTQKAELLEEVDRLLNTFNALLRISRIEAEQKRSRFTDVDLDQILDDIVAFYEPLAEEKSIQLTSKLSKATVYGDRDLLFQAFANQLDNALKFTPENGKINVSLYHSKSRNYVEISDTGTGIAEQEQDKIFNRFYRGEKSRSSSGTGLGLSLVSAVVNLHNGSIQVKNTESGLTIITIL